MLDIIKVRLTLTREMLGTLPSQKDIYDQFVRSKSPNPQEDEYPSQEDDISKGLTIFHKGPNGEPCLIDYQIKGFLKAAGETIRERRKTEGAKGDKSGWEAWKRKVDVNVHVFPRYIPLGVNTISGVVERPLRAETMRGPRVTLASSECVEAGATAEIEIVLRGVLKMEQIIECLDEGRFYGLGQWRNSGMGRFTYEILPQEAPVKPIDVEALPEVTVPKKKKVAPLIIA